MYKASEIVSTILLCICCKRDVHIHDTLSVSEDFMPFSKGMGHFMFVLCTQCKNLKIEYTTSEVLQEKDRLSEIWKTVYPTAKNLYLFFMTREEATSITSLMMSTNRGEMVVPVVTIDTIKNNVTENTVTKSIKENGSNKTVKNFF